jgi:hypothetical protein
MKALTLTQPWATLVAIGAKTIETRSWFTNYRGPLAIHAAAGYGPGGRHGFNLLVCSEPFRSALWKYWSDRPRHLDTLFATLPMGVVLATCELVAVAKIASLGYSCDPGEPEKSFGDYTPGRYAWYLYNVQALPKPIPAKGKLGLWEWDAPLGALREMQR